MRCMSTRSARLFKWLARILTVMPPCLLLGARCSGRSASSSAACPSIACSCRTGSTSAAACVVEFRTLSARLRLYGPELVFDEAVVRTPDRTHVLATAQRGSVGFDLWTSIGNGAADRRALHARVAGDRPDPHARKAAFSCSGRARCRSASQAVRDRTAADRAASMCAMPS